MWSCHTDLIVSLLMNMRWVTEWQTLYHMNPFSTPREYAVLYNTNSVCVCKFNYDMFFNYPICLGIWSCGTLTFPQLTKLP